MRRRHAGRGRDPAPVARSGVSGRADARAQCVRGDPGGGRRPHADGDLRHRLRRVHAQGLRGPRARLLAEAVRPRPLPADAAARARVAGAPPGGRPGSSFAGARQRHQDRAWAITPRSAGGEVRWPRVLPAHRRARLDRGGRQLRAAAPGRRVTPLSRDHEPHGIAARQPPLRPHSPLEDRQHRAGEGAAALVQRRARGSAAERHPPDAQSRLSREAPGTAETRLFKVQCGRLGRPPAPWRLR